MISTLFINKIFAKIFNNYFGKKVYIFISLILLILIKY